MRAKRPPKAQVKFEGWTHSEGGVDACDGIGACYGRSGGRYGGVSALPATEAAAAAEGEWRIPLESRCKGFQDCTELLRPRALPAASLNPPAEVELKRPRPRLKLPDSGSSFSTMFRGATKPPATGGSCGGLGRHPASADNGAAARPRRGQAASWVLPPAGAAADSGAAQQRSAPESSSAAAAAAASGSGRSGETPQAAFSATKRGLASELPLASQTPPLVAQLPGRSGDGAWAGAGRSMAAARELRTDDGAGSRASESSDGSGTPQRRQFDEFRRHLRRSFTGMTPNLIRLVTTHIISHGKRSKDDGAGHAGGAPLLPDAREAPGARADASRTQVPAPGLPGKCVASGITWALEFPDIWRTQREQTLIVRKNC